jgi:hypothetical protein
MTILVSRRGDESLLALPQLAMAALSHPHEPPHPQPPHHAPLQGAWRRQALPARGLLQGSCYRWHAPLHRARRRQAVRARGLLQVSRSSSRQPVLHVVSAGHTAAARRCGGSQPYGHDLADLREFEDIQQLVERPSWPMSSLSQ